VPVKVDNIRTEDWLDSYYLRLDGSTTMTGDLAMGGNEIYGNSTSGGDLYLRGTSHGDNNGDVIVNDLGGNITLCSSTILKANFTNEYVRTDDIRMGINVAYNNARIRLYKEVVTNLNEHTNNIKSSVHHARTTDGSYWVQNLMFDNTMSGGGRAYTAGVWGDIYNRNTDPDSIAIANYGVVRVLNSARGKNTCQVAVIEHDTDADATSYTLFSGSIVGAGTGTPATAKGLSLGNIDVATDNWAIYTRLGTVYFGDDLGVGITAPTANAHVKGLLTTALTGTVAATNGSDAIVGTGTNFDNGEIAVGDAIKIESDEAAGYEIFTVATITDDTNLTVDSNYAGTTDSGLDAWSDSDLFRVDDGDGSNAITVTKSRYVGLRIAAPAHPLQLSLSGDYFSITDSGDSDGDRVRIGDSSGNGGYISLYDDSETSTALIRSYAISSVQAYFIAGNVGIGDTAPNQLLGLLGANAQISVEESDTEFIRIGVGETEGKAIIGWDDGTDLQLGLYTSPTDTTIDPKMTISSAGVVDVVGGLTAGSFISDTTIASGTNLAAGTSLKVSTFTQATVDAQDIVLAVGYNLTPATSYITLNNANAVGTAITLVEAAAILDGMEFEIHNIDGANNITFANIAGVQVVNGGAITLGPNDVVKFRYVTNQYIQSTVVSNN